MQHFFDQPPSANVWDSFDVQRKHRLYIYKEIS